MDERYTYDELLVLSYGILALIRDAGHAMELAGADSGVRHALEHVMEKYRALNKKVCAMAEKSCGDWDGCGGDRISKGAGAEDCESRMRDPQGCAGGGKV